MKESPTKERQREIYLNLKETIRPLTNLLRREQRAGETLERTMRQRRVQMGPVAEACTMRLMMRKRSRKELKKNARQSMKLSHFFRVQAKNQSILIMESCKTQHPSHPNTSTVNRILTMIHPPQY